MFFRRAARRLTIAQLWRVLTSLRIKVLIALISGLVGLAVVSFTVGTKWAPTSPASAPIATRVPVSGLLSFDASFAHTDTAGWIIPIVKYLDGPGYAVVKLQTEPFSNATQDFRIDIEPNGASALAGVVFRVRPAKPAGA